MNKRTLENDEFCSLSWTENNNEELYEFGTNPNLTSGIPNVDRIVFQEINEKLLLIIV